MNRRQWKKRCKRAAAELERRWPGEFTLEPAKGDETVYAPPTYQPQTRNRRRYRMEKRYASAPKGAPGAWIKASYEYDEWDFHLADELLDQMELAHDTDWEALARAEGLLEDAA